MDKALKMGKISAMGSFQLFIGYTLSTVILAVGTIVLGILLQEAEYGLYAVALTPATTILLFKNLGIGIATTKYCAQYKNTGNKKDLRKIISVGVTSEVATGLFLTVFSLVISNFIAVFIFGNPESAFLIIISSIAIFFAALFNAANSVFIGFERMNLSSYTIACQAIIQCGISSILAYLGYGAFGAIIGFTIAYIVAGVLGIFLLYFAIFRKLDSNVSSKLNTSKTVMMLVRYGVPLAIATIVGSTLLPQFCYFVMASTVDYTLIGNYKIATNFAILLTFFTFPITTVLFPAFSKLNPQNEPELLKTVFASSVKYTALLLVPATMAMMVLSKSLIATMYADKWLQAPPFLTLYVISNLFAIFGNLSVTSLFSALGEKKSLIELNMLTLAIGIPGGFLLIPLFGILGVIFVIVIAGLPSIFIGIYWAWKRYGTKADFHVSAKIFFAAAIAAIVTSLVIIPLNVAEWIRLLVGSIAFLGIYLTTIPLVGALDTIDLDNLRNLFSNVGFASKIIDIPLLYMRKILKIRRN